MAKKYFGRSALEMKYVYIYCEGQTEEAFVNDIPYPYFSRIGIYVQPIIHKTKRTPTKSFRGGVSKYEPIKNEIIKLCQDPNCIVTTMFDYYAMPEDTPAITYSEIDIYKRVDFIENAVNKDIGCENLIFNLILHEFEALLFSEPQAFEHITNDKAVKQLQAIRNSAETPEHINNSVETAPSKRIASVVDNYSKVRQGIIVAKHIGIDKMLSECKHFSAWINKIIKFT